MRNKLVILRPEKKLKVVETTEKHISLETLQKAVEGHIELVRFNTRLVEAKIDMFINEEGKLIGLKPSTMLINEDGWYEIIAGNIIFTSFDSEGNSLPLTDEQVAIIKEVFDTRITVKGNIVYLA